MSRLIVDVTGEQHQTIKALAAIEGKSMKDYILERIIPVDKDDEVAALSELKSLLEKRIARADDGDVSTKSVSQLTDETLRNLDTH